ncbi:TonB-dependent receptor [Woodsholea maritima]|uniref:TonB-dependent receptor n=1 Tax=Woodsholea maritima TaxID=240237 RepID=UPI001461413F|nr:TonB-dependent receptor [Woodsholea maritima]
MRQFFMRSASIGILLSGLTGGAFAQAASPETAQHTDPEDIIVVTGTRLEQSLLEAPVAISVQDFDTLNARGFSYGTDEFRGVPGVFFRRGEGDGEEFPFISIRGVTGNHGNDTFLAMIDGIPFVGPDEEVLLYALPYAAIDRVEIVRGPVSALYGRGAIAGAVNYITTSPQEDETQIAATVGSDGLYRLNASRAIVGENSHLLASLSAETFEGWRDNSQRDTFNVFLRAQTQLSPRTTLTGYLNYFDRQADIPSTLPTLSDGTVLQVKGGARSFLGYGTPRNEMSGIIGAATVNYQASDALSFDVRAQIRHYDGEVNLNFYDYFELDADNSIMGVNGFKSPNDALVLFAEATATYRSGTHTLIAGLSAERATLDERDTWSGQNGFDFACGFKFYAILIDYSTGDVTNADHPCFINDVRSAAETTNQFYGIFLQDEIKLSPRWTLTLGGRYDWFDRETDFSIVGSAPSDLVATGSTGAFAPKATLAYDYGPGLIYASYGRGFNSNFGPVWQWEPSQYVREERPTTIDSVELGWKGESANGRLIWEAAVFYLEQKDRRTFVDNPDPSGPPNIATTGQLYSSRGLEASLRWNVSDKTSTLINYTYLDPQWDEFTLTSYGNTIDFSGKTPQGVAQNIIYAEVTHQATDWLNLTASYEGYDDYFVTADNSVSGGAFNLLNASARLELPVEGLGLDLSLTNLLDEDYYYLFGGSRTAATNATPGTPRQIRATLRARF